MKETKTQAIKIKGKRVIYPLLFIILTAIVILNVSRNTSSGSQNKVVAYKVEGGWGYRVIQHEKVIIDQSFIPLISGKNPFPSKKSALKTGKIVLERLEKKQTPVLTFEDLEEQGLVR